MWKVWWVVFFGGFLSGVVTLFALEALGVYLLIKRFNRKTQQDLLKLSHVSPLNDLDPHQSLDFINTKKGYVWVLESDKVPKDWQVEKAPKEQRRKKEFFEVTPVRKYAKIKDRSIILTEPDGTLTAILLKGCTIDAVSATDLSSKKWGKRFPIRIESKTSVIYNSSKTVYIYLKTSWEKESWCKALRLVSCDSEDRRTWFVKLNQEFHCYLASLNTGYPSFMKPSVGSNVEAMENMSQIDGSTSKVRLLLKKLAKKASKTAVEHRVISMFGREERKINDKIRSFNDPVLASSSVKTARAAKAPNNSDEDNMSLPSLSTYSRSSSQSVVSDVDYDDRFSIDEGTLCWNLLISRLFFDAKSNTQMKSSVQARFQRTLSNMRIPSYIGEIKCTDVNFGNLPPYIRGIRVLPTDMNEAWAWEVDVEYCDGLELYIETRLEVGDLDLQKGIVDANSESTSVGDVASELLEDFEYLQKQFSDGNDDAQDRTNEEVPKLDRLKDKNTISAPVSTNVSKWKAILKSLAKHVQQVPISLSIRVASLRGTVRLHIKPPPSDQLWYGFTSMPDMEFDLKSSIGEHKITSTHVAPFLINRFKNTIRETMVLPNCESVCIPWMLAEKNDWVCRKFAPFMWLNQEVTSDRAAALETISSQPDEAKMKTGSSNGTTSGRSEGKYQKNWNDECNKQQISSSSDTIVHSLSSINTKPMMQICESLQDQTTPLLTSYEPQDICQQSRGFASECQSLSKSVKLPEQPNNAVEEGDSKLKRMGRRARMLDMTKKVGEKLEEKKRHIEERGRNIVEKMRGT